MLIQSTVLVVEAAHVLFILMYKTISSWGVRMCTIFVSGALGNKLQQEEDASIISNAQHVVKRLICIPSTMFPSESQGQVVQFVHNRKIITK